MDLVEKIQRIVLERHEETLAVAKQASADAKQARKIAIICASKTASAILIGAALKPWT